MNTGSGSYNLIPEINMGEATLEKRVGENRGFSSGLWL